MGGSRSRRARPELVSARVQRGMSQEAAAEALGVTPTTWARWERGEQGVRACYRPLIAAVFGVEAVEVERWIDGWSYGETSSWPIAGCDDDSPAATVKSAALLWRLEMDPSRRHLLASLPFVPGALGEWLVSWNYGTPTASAARLDEGREVGLADVARIVEAQKAFGQIDQRFGAGLVRPVVVKYLHETVAPLLRGRYDERVGSELMTAAAGMTWLAGWTAFDLNRHGQAQQHFGQALRLAKNADDPLTGAWVLATLTLQAIHLEQGAWAVWLGRAAVDTARRAQAPPRVMAVMLAREARATALQTKPAESHDRHSAKQVERLLVEVERAYAQGATDRDPEWVRKYDEVELNGQAGGCWRLLGDYARAAACAEAAVTEFSERLPRSAQINRLSAAGAYLGMGELDQALACARAAIPATKTLTSARTVERLQRFAGQLEPYGDSVMVREFRDHLNSELAA
ncbi:helix-turn-helix transcriptional regulator [Streptosporangium sp. NPDC049046]|uniref:helix-turn-helix domain-containing protein n=1 Tax=Streptosporangium sp. NPDC049046 TaxID=3155031 RepID=UPI003447434A